MEEFNFANWTLVSARNFLRSIILFKRLGKLFRFMNEKVSKEKILFINVINEPCKNIFIYSAQKNYFTFELVLAHIKF